MPTMKANVHLRHPETEEKVVLEKGQEIPEWADDLLDEKLVEPDPPPPPRQRKKKAAAKKKVPAKSLDEIQASKVEPEGPSDEAA